MTDFDRIAHHKPNNDGLQVANNVVRAQDLLAVIAATVLVILFVDWLLPDPTMTLEFVLSMLLLQSAVPLVTVYLLFIRGRGFRWRDIGFRPAPRRWYLRAVLIAFVSVPVVAGANLVVQGLTGGPLRNPQIELLAPASLSWTAFIGTLLVTGVAAPIAEEVVFRGLFYRWLRQHTGSAISIAISALVFALAHAIVVLIPALAVQGAILALVYERSGSLWPPIILHGTFNATMIAALYAAIAVSMAPGVGS